MKSGGKNIPHSRAEEPEHDLPSDCWSEYSAVDGRGGNRQEEGVRGDTQKVEATL